MGVAMSARIVSWFACLLMRAGAAMDQWSYQRRTR